MSIGKGLVFLWALNKWTNYILFRDKKKKEKRERSPSGEDRTRDKKEKKKKDRSRSRDKKERKRDRKSEEKVDPTKIKAEVKEEKIDEDDRSFDFNDLYADTSAAPIRKEKLEIKQEVGAEAADELAAETTTSMAEVKVEKDDEDTFIMPTAIDPKLIDSMDPATIRRMLAGQAVSKYVAL